MQRIAQNETVQQKLSKQIDQIWQPFLLLNYMAIKLTVFIECDLGYQVRSLTKIKSKVMDKGIDERSK